MEAGQNSPGGPEKSGEFNGLLSVEHERQDGGVLELATAADQTPIREEKVEEFMQELYRELFYKPAAPADHATASFRSGNVVDSETCGPSVSDSASTVMAGIVFAGPTWRFSAGNVGSAPETGGGYWWGYHDSQVKKENSNGYYCRCKNDQKRFGKGVMDGCDLGEELDDEWLARVLSWGPVELDPWF